MPRLIPAPLSLLLLAAASPGREVEAPPPPHWTSWNPDDGDSDQKAVPSPPQGYYGHGFAEPMDLAERPSDSCGGGEAAIAKATSGLPEYRVEFWLFATAQQGILFRRGFEWDHRRPCAVKLSYGVERAFIADGLIHSFTMADEGDLKDSDTRPRKEDDGGHSGGFSLIHNLMARKPVKAKGSRTEIAGFPALCRGVSGLAYETVCRSEAVGPAHGMIVKAVAGDDIKEGSHLELDRLIPRARLSGRMFDLETLWSPRSNGAPEAPLTSEGGGD